MTNEELAALILPWAKEHRPEPYAKTIAVAGNPRTFNAYLSRLIELRWEADREWRNEVPLRALEATALVVRMRHPGLNVEIEVKGSRAEGPRQWSFLQLASAIDAGIKFETLYKVVTGFDLEIVG